MTKIKKKKIYLYGFNSEQVKIIKAKNKNVLFIDEDVVTETIKINFFFLDFIHQCL